MCQTGKVAATLKVAAEAATISGEVGKNTVLNEGKGDNALVVQEVNKESDPPTGSDDLNHAA